MVVNQFAAIRQIEIGSDQCANGVAFRTTWTAAKLLGTVTYLVTGSDKIAAHDSEVTSRNGCPVMAS